MPAFQHFDSWMKLASSGHNLVLTVSLQIYAMTSLITLPVPFFGRKARPFFRDLVFFCTFEIGRRLEFISNYESPSVSDVRYYASCGDPSRWFFSFPSRRPSRAPFSRSLTRFLRFFYSDGRFCCSSCWSCFHLLVSRSERPKDLFFFLVF